MADGLGVPIIRSILGATVQSVVTSSLTQLGQKRLPGELPITSGCLNHDWNNRVAGFLHENTPLWYIKFITYALYDVKK